jgi:hypothetical protein
MTMILDGSNGVTFNDASLQGAAASPFTLKNRIINGAMVVDQRNAGASVTPASLAFTYTLDRWVFYCSQSSKLTAQQNAGSVAPPAGFTNYLGVTSSSAYSITSSDQFVVRQPIEGFNTADLGFGTANASTVTLSFWVRSSLTGTFGGSLQNSDGNRSYAFSYTISAANTWEQKTITITGDTTGTWIGATNGTGLIVTFSLGVGSNLSGTAGSWVGAGNNSSTGATSVVGTNGATWYVTGVQLEVGSTATPFERRLYNQELANCQRYYEKIVVLDVSGYVQVGKQTHSNIQLVPKRTTPTLAAGSNTNSDNFTSYTITFGTGDFQHGALLLVGTNGGLNYIRTTFNNLTFDAEL